MVPQLQVDGHVPKKYLPMSLFNIHVRLHRCVNIWMVKFGEFLVSCQFSNCSGTKASLHMVFQLAFRVNSFKVVLVRDINENVFNNKYISSTLAST